MLCRRHRNLASFLAVENGPLSTYAKTIVFGTLVVSYNCKTEAAGFDELPQFVKDQSHQKRSLAA